MKIRTVFFDLGNTLLYNQRLNSNSIRIACEKLAEAFQAFNYPVHPNELAEKHFQNLMNYYNLREMDYIEHSADIILSHTLEEMGFSHVPEEHILKSLKAFYASTEANWYLTDYAIDTLELLQNQNLKIGLITNASYAEDIRQLLQKYHLEKYFQSVIISAETGYRKPRQEIFDLALYSLASSPAESVMVGDSFMADIWGAYKKGMHTIWFNRYAVSSQLMLLLCKPDAVTSSLKNIPDIIDTFENNS